MKTDSNKVNRKYISKEIKPLECTLYVQMRPLWKLLRIWGVLPFVELNEEGDLAFYWLSPSVLYSLVIITLIWASLVTIIIYRIRLIMSISQPSFNFQVFNILNILVPSPVLFIPITFWVDTRNFVKYVQDFAKFETQYYRIFNKKLDVKIRKCCIFVLVIIVTYTLSVTSIFVIIDPRLIWYHQLPYVQILPVLYMQLPYCGFLSHILMRSSDNIQKKMAKEALIKYDSSSVIREYRLLWLKLSNLSRNIFSIFMRAVLLVTIFTAASLTFCTYTCISIILNIGFNPRAVIFSITTTLISTMMYFMAYRTEMLYCSTGKNFFANFFKNRRNLNCYRDDAVGEIKIFIKMFRGIDLKITNEGYFSLSQSAFVSLISLMTTYILIIVQFSNYEPKLTSYGNGTDWDDF